MTTQPESTQSLFTVDLCRAGYGFTSVEIEATNEFEAQQAALDLAGNLSYNEKSSEYTLTNPVLAPGEVASEPPPVLVLDATSKATILAALTYYVRSGQGEPFNRTQEIQGLAAGPDDSVISLDDAGVLGLIEQVCKTGVSEGAHKESLQPFMTAVAGHVVIHEPQTGTPLSDEWTGVCVDARDVSSFWYIGRSGGERSFKKLQAATQIDARLEGAIAADVENAQGNAAERIRPRQS